MHGPKAPSVRDEETVPGAPEDSRGRRLPFPETPAPLHRVDAAGGRVEVKSVPPPPHPALFGEGDLLPPETRVG